MDKFFNKSVNHSVICSHCIDRKMCGEAASVDDGVVEECVSCKWSIVCKDYRPEDIFNTDERGAFLLHHLKL